jgi:hypothetical protein
VHHLDVGSRLAHGVKAQPLVEPPGWIPVEHLETHGNAALCGLSQHRTNYVATQTVALDFGGQLDAGQKNFIGSLIDSEKPDRFT